MEDTKPVRDPTEKIELIPKPNDDKTLSKGPATTPANKGNDGSLLKDADGAITNPFKQAATSEEPKKEGAPPQPPGTSPAPATKASSPTSNFTGSNDKDSTDYSIDSNIANISPD